jgi:hypothetical protein
MKALVSPQVERAMIFFKCLSAIWAIRAINSSDSPV